MRIGVLVDHLRRQPHPRFTAEHTSGWAEKLTVERDAVAAASEALRAPTVRREQMERAYFAIVRTAQAALANCKRELKLEGMTEARIHEVIPSHPRPRGERSPASAEPSGPSTGSAG